MPQTTKYEHRSTSPSYPRGWRKTASYPSGEASHLRIADKDGCGALKVTFHVPKKPAVVPAVDETVFYNLVSQWRKETAHQSILTKKVMHSSYQRIIGMGSDAIPLILREMKSRPGHWFWALDAITQGKESPASGSKDLEEATAAWLAWGEAKGYL